MIKTTGAEFKEFYNDSEFWPESAWHDYETITRNGKVKDDYIGIADSDIITIEGGAVYEVPDEPTFEEYFKLWRKKQSTAIIVVECLKEKSETLKTAIKELGGKIR